MQSADQLREFLLAQIAEQCGIRRQDVDPGRPLTELGLSSRGALAVRRRVEDVQRQTRPPDDPGAQPRRGAPAMRVVSGAGCPEGGQNGIEPLPLIRIVARP